MHASNRHSTASAAGSMRSSRLASAISRSIGNRRPSRVSAQCDFIIDIGPGAGSDGGRLLYAGPPAGLMEVAESLTGRALQIAEEGTADQFVTR